MRRVELPTGRLRDACSAVELHRRGCTRRGSNSHGVLRPPGFKPGASAASATRTEMQGCPRGESNSQPQKGPAPQAGASTEFRHSDKSAWVREARIELAAG